MPNREPQVDFGPLSNSLGFLLRIAQVDAFTRFFGTGLPPDLRLGEVTILEMVARNPGIRQGVLATALRIKRAHMTKLIHALEGRALVTTQVPPEDRRALTLNITPEGLAWVKTCQPLIDTAEAAIPGALSPKETAELNRLLRKFLGLSAAQTKRKEPES